MVKQHFDIVVIGAGPAGIECAKMLADNGKQVLLIDKNIGGSYCFAGSVVSNLLLHISYLYERSVNKASNFINVEYDKSPSFDFKKAKKYIDGVTSKLVKDFQDDLEESGVQIIRGTAVFEDANTFRVTDDKQSFLIGFSKAVIATGSNNMGANVPSTKKLLDSTNIFELTAAPKSVIVVGGGFIGTEFATFFRRIGSTVTIIEKTEKVLATIDRQVVKDYEDQMKKNGVEIVKGVSVERIEKVGNKTIVFLSNDTKLESEEVFLSIGRKPNMGRLSVDAAGIKLCEKGFPKLTKNLRTTNRNVYVVGDCTGINMFVNWAYMSADMVANDILERSKIISADYCPRILHLDPEIAAVGLSEDKAKEQGIECKVIRHTFKNFEKAIMSGTLKGFIKIIYDDSTKKILGCHAIGSGAADLVTTFSMMIQSKISLNKLEDFVFNHPTFSGVLADIAGKVK
ncbi:dihydrolipoyl dehydrogenase family protein [Seleniivibrio woodruffii]|uniref:Dihydrolipoamide dehydrogenase n=1 Tax=Seleniivibrio woodruffii TaxID=1078050 RepID=A0A4R1KA04_9BACT|nr:NAD(P)/FAD-dependent oxidoreductase [Seleniivibrio woodruffii]TCK60723.1 dihydrolipoamide dehydrogenase [Seleniivibrio woodruffii]TVZ36353.1 dihydrolipoamide dehydrogenase [Seleniivibrio woodruffii]